MRIEKSQPKDHKILTEITKQSKNFWNYPDEWMKLWDEDLTITKEYIEKNNVFHFKSKNGEIFGYYSYCKEENNIRLEHLFIEPNSIGKGIGRMLMSDFFEKINDEDFENIIVDSDPNAEAFYEKLGFKNLTYKKTKIEGRFLPVMIKNKF